MNEALRALAETFPHVELQSVDGGGWTLRVWKLEDWGTYPGPGDQRWEVIQYTGETAEEVAGDAYQELYLKEPR